MPEPFKNAFSPALIKSMAGHIRANWSGFDSALFIKTATNKLETLELKERMAHITDALILTLPKDFQKAGTILVNSLGQDILEGETIDKPDETGISGWGSLPLTHFVSRKGMDDLEFSMSLLKEMTKLFSAEFDIRFFILKYPKETLRILNVWTRDENRHVRRLVSEGTRPRLPWAMQLPDYVNDPRPILPLLEALKDDDEEYVRRSVANNLNDIAKDHPELVVKLAQTWLKDATKNRQRLVRHACRTLIKQGNLDVLKVFGYTHPKLSEFKCTIQTPKVDFGGHLEFEIECTNKQGHNQELLIDYIIHHKKANGKTSPKVFKWRLASLAPNKSLKLAKKHAFKPISTRVYYSGGHHLEIMVNGVSFGVADFELMMK